jgi:hypothetical protein
MWNWEVVDVAQAITNALLIGILVELVQINAKIGKK